ncbi:MAG TPA: hypothetical protein VME42_17170 [Steroidobacteraceae bacterium]|nr:hypothetical protein [Steroidobacteraceae bacterium]
MRKLLVAPLAAALVCGCAASGEGAGMASPPAAAESAPPGLLIIGRTGPLHPLSEDERKGAYQSYLRLAASRHPGKSPALAPAEFQARLAGWASIQTAGILPVGSAHRRVFVPSTLAGAGRTASLSSSLPFGGSGELVAAESDGEGLVWIDRVLCQGGGTFRACARKYRAGVFDASSGQELARDGKPKSGGARVDVSSYLNLTPESKGHTASELEVRAIDRCDDCKRAVPGSVQSTVPVPPLDNR